MNEPKPPSELVKWQKWFARVLACKPKSSMKECAKGTKRFPSSKEMIADAVSLSSQECMEIYVRGYWFKLIDFLREQFPLTSGLIKKRALFEKIALPYLAANPFYDFSIEKIGLKFADWIEKHYLGRDKANILTAARIDQAFCTLSFFSKKRAHLRFNEKTKLFLQPCVLLFETSGNFLALREEIVKQRKVIVKDTIISPANIGAEQATEYFMLFCGSKNEVFYQPLSFVHFSLLKMFKEGASFKEARSFFKDKCYPSFIDLLTFDETLEEWKEKGLFTADSIS